MTYGDGEKKQRESVGYITLSRLEEGGGEIICGKI